MTLAYKKNCMKHVVTIPAIAALMCLQTQAGAAEHAGWPEIQSLEVVHTITHDSPNMALTVFSAMGKPAYRLACHPYDYADEDGFDYSGFFHCRLQGLGPDEVLNDIFKPSLDWARFWTRARFDAPVGACRNHPYYGHRRVFLARGMEIGLEIKNYRASPGIVRLLKGEKPRYRFDFRVSVKNNPAANLPHAAPVPEYCASTYSIDGKGRLVEKVTIQAD